MNPKLILAVALALLLLVSAPAQGQTPTAAFTFSPEAPVPGQDVQFQATSGAGASHMWDPDDDGAFDDAEGPRAKRSFDAGAHVVRLRARFPDQKIIIGLWNSTGGKAEERVRSSSADKVVTTLTQVLEHI